MRYKAIDPTLFVENRKRFTAAMADNAIAIFHSSDQMPRTADQTHAFRQQPDLFYLSGIDQEETILFLFPDAPVPEYREILFVRETNEHIAVWEGHKYTIEEARKASGIQTVKWTSDFEGIFGMMMHHAENVYLNLNENDRAASGVVYKDLQFAHDTQHRFPLHSYHRCGPIMSRLRAIKSPIEIQLMQQACDITDKAFRRLLGFVKPGVMEYEVEAELIHEYIRNGGNGHAYEPIVASGESACVLHYVDNNQMCKDGDLLLLDTGADYANYAADLSRTIPVNGRFTDRQKAVYNAVLDTMKKATDMLRPGVIISEYQNEVNLMLESHLVDLGILDTADMMKNSGKPRFKQYTCHNTSHFIGIDVHDIGNRYAPIEAGMVFTVEPGLYLRKEGIGVRIENDVLIGENGNFDLMRNIPREVEEIEDLMNA